MKYFTKRSAAGKRLIRISVCLVLFLLFFTITGFKLLTRGSVLVHATMDIPASEPVFFQQEDPSWAKDTLGASGYTMESSGCLTTCLATVLFMQSVPAGPFAESPDPGLLNQYFSENSIYDAEGNIQWEPLEVFLGCDIIRLQGDGLRSLPPLQTYTDNAVSDTENGQNLSEFMESLLSSNIFPIVRVRMGGFGSYHYVTVVGSQDGNFLCMDPLGDGETLTPLSRFGNRVYAVRFLV